MKKTGLCLDAAYLLSALQICCLRQPLLRGVDEPLSHLLSLHFIPTALQSAIYADIGKYETKSPCIYFLLPIQFRVTGGMEAIPAAMERRVGYTLERSPACHRADTERQTTIHSPFHTYGFTN